MGAQTTLRGRIETFPEPRHVGLDLEDRHHD